MNSLRLQKTTQTNHHLSTAMSTVSSLARAYIQLGSQTSIPFASGERNDRADCSYQSRDVAFSTIGIRCTRQIELICCI